MSKALSVLGAVGAVAVVGALTVGPTLLSDPPADQPADVRVASIVAATEPVDRSTWRQAVADWPCLQAAGITPDRIREVCLWGRLVAGHIVCLTERVQVHPCEVSPPPVLLKRYGICRYQLAGEWRLHKEWEAVDWTPPAEWTNVSCTVILPSGFWHQSMAGVEDALVLALRDKCGWGDEIQPDSWGNCPDCLMWPEGCGPCRAIADKYGRGWVGHEAECEVE